MPPDYERRTFERTVELRAAPDGASGPGILHGYGAVFNSESRDLGGFVEIIDPGAFGPPGELEGAVDLALHGRVIARTNHDSNYLLGTTDVGTLRLFVDEVGLRFEVDLPATSYARDLAVLAGRGDIRFSSFAFRTPPDGDSWGFNENDQIVRRVLTATLVDVAPVADPAYWEATSELSRSFDLAAIRAALTIPDSPDVSDARTKAASERARVTTNSIKKGRA